MTSLVVRVAVVADVGALARLRYQWRVGERGERGLDEAAFEKSLFTWLEEHRDTHIPFMALREGEPIGMAWLVLVDRVPGPEHFVRRSAYVQSVYVVAGERSTGVGTALLQLVLEHSHRLGLDYVAVHPSEKSFSLYRRLGFTTTGRVLELPREKRLDPTVGPDHLTGVQDDDDARGTLISSSSPTRRTSGN